MTFLNVNDADRLFGAFDRCVGNVELIAPDGKTYDWGTYGRALRSFLPNGKRIDRLEVRVRDSRDQARMLRLMMEERAG